MEVIKKNNILVGNMKEKRRNLELEEVEEFNKKIYGKILNISKLNEQIQRKVKKL